MRVGGDASWRGWELEGWSWRIGVGGMGNGDREIGMLMAEWD